MVDFWVIYFLVGLLYTSLSLCAEPLGLRGKTRRWFSNFRAQIAARGTKLGKIGKVALETTFLLVVLMVNIFIGPLAFLYMASYWVTTKINR